MATRSKKSSVLLLTLGLMMVTLTAIRQSFAADRHRLELKDIPNLVGASELNSAIDVAISPDGKWVAYSVSTTALTTGVARQQVFVQPFQGGEAIPAGPEKADNMGPVWSPDSKKLLFHSAAEGKTSLVIWTADDKKTRVTDISARFIAGWLPDSASFVAGIGHESTDRKTTSKDKGSEPIVFTSGETNHFLDGEHFIGLFPPATRDQSFDFAVVDAATGKRRTVAENVDPNFLHYEISPSGTKLLYTIRKGLFDYDANKRVVYDIDVIDLRQGAGKVVARDVLGAGLFSPAWSHNEKMLAVVGGTLEDDHASPPQGSRMWDRPGHCYVIELEKPGALRPVGPRSFWRDAAPIWGDNDLSIYAVSSLDQARTSRKIVKLDVATGAAVTVGSIPVVSDVEFQGPKPGGETIYVSGMNAGAEKTEMFAFNLRSHEWTRLVEGEYTAWSLSSSNGGARFAYVAVDSSHPANVWIGERGGEGHALTRFGASQQVQQRIGESKVISWDVVGKTLYGTVWLPANYRPGQRCPTIVDVYPTYQDMKNYFRGNPFSDSLIWPAFSEAGYAIFWPDAELQVGEGPQELAAQILPALDKIVALGIADPNGLGVYGRSHGGYSTFALITETQRFKAAMTGSGYANLLTAYDELGDDSSPYVGGLLENDHLGTNPWRNRELYTRDSPYFNFDKVTTPVLIQYGQIDRPFAWTSREAFVALRRLGKTVTLLGYPDEGHGVNKPENQVDFTNRALDWFDRYLKPDNGKSTESN